MFGILDVSLVPMYGNGHGAWVRLQRELLDTRPDESIFAWTASPGTLPRHSSSPAWKAKEWGLLAPYAECFRDSHDVMIGENFRHRSSGSIAMTREGVRFLMIWHELRSTSTELMPLQFLLPFSPVAYERYVHSRRKLFSATLNCWRKDEKGKQKPVMIFLSRDGKDDLLWRRCSTDRLALDRAMYTNSMVKDFRNPSIVFTQEVTILQPSDIGFLSKAGRLYASEVYFDELCIVMCGARLPSYNASIDISSNYLLITTQRYEMVQCTLSLIALRSGDAASDFLTKAGSGIRLITGVPHGWVLQPHSRESKSLVGRAWDLFVVTEASDQAFETAVQNFAAAYVKATVSIPTAQYEDLLANINSKATPAKETPPLPEEFSDGKTGQVPNRHILPAKDGPLEPGELKLYEPMAKFLSTILPATVRDKPVSLFNLFKYPDGDASVHEHYMQGFKEKFGPAAGAQLKFMGPVVSQPEYVEGLQTGSRDGEMGWQDANIVQYDSIWHYVYMLSTDVYQELNKEKVRGLEDTCILLVSEIELQE